MLFHAKTSIKTRISTLHSNGYHDNTVYMNFFYNSKTTFNGRHFNKVWRCFSDFLKRYTKLNYKIHIMSLECIILRGHSGMQKNVPYIMMAHRYLSTQYLKLFHRHLFFYLWCQTKYGRGVPEPIQFPKEAQKL